MVKTQIGLKLTLDTSFFPQTGAKNGKVKAEYKHDLVCLNTDVDLNLEGPTVNGCAVIGHQGWLAGYQMAYDTNKSKLKKNNFALGYRYIPIIRYHSTSSHLKDINGFF